jgi:hypothetical protein
MASTIKLKNGSGAPLAGDLVQGEPALDLTNKRLYTEDSLGNVIEVGINPSSLTIGGTALTATAAELNTLDGITATTAELNTLDGITATVTELNYTDGVTSNIQTQLNTKAPIASPTFTGTVTAPAVNVNGTVTADGLTVDGDQRTNGDITINYSGLTINAGGGIFAGQTPSIDIRSDASSGTPYAELMTIRGATATADLISRTVGLSLKTSSEINTNETGKGYDIYANTQLTYGNDPDFYIDRSNGAHRLKISANGDISFYEDTGTTAKFFWDASTERLGLGTTIPDALFHAKGSTQGGAEAIIETENGGGSFGPALHLKRTSASPADNDLLGALRFTGSNSALAEREFARINVLANDVTNGSEDGSLLFSTTSGGSLSERMRIDNAGNVGIGTASPAFTLDVNGTFATSGGVFLHDATSSASNAVEVGRGRSVDGAVYLDFTAAAGSSDFDFRMIRGSGANGDAEFRNKGTGSILFKINGFTEAARIDSSGNLLVGTTASTLNLAISSGAHLGVAVDAVNDIVIATRASGHGLIVNRTGTDGDIAQFRKDGSTVGSIGTNSSRIYIGTGDTGLGMSPTTDSVFPIDATTGNTRDAAINLGVSNVRFKDLYLSGGVVFGTGGAAKTLDDYETGTWTPTLTGATSGSITGFTVTKARYVKTGDTVFATAYLSNINVSTSTIVGGFLFGGLPFASEAFMSSFDVKYTNLFLLDEVDTSISGYVSGIQSFLTKGSALTSVSDSDLNTAITAGTLMVSVVYEAA